MTVRLGCARCAAICRYFITTTSHFRCAARKWCASHGCSTLDCDELRQAIEASESGAISVLAQRAGAIGLENVEGKTAQAGEHAGIAPDTGAIFAEGDVSAVVRSRLDAPMGADCLGSAAGIERFVGDVECRLRGATQQPGLGAAGVDDAIDTEDGTDMNFPVVVTEFARGVEDDDSAAFVATARLVMAVAGAERFRDGGDVGDCLEKGRLVALYLNNQGDVGLLGDLEVFF